MLLQVGLQIFSFITVIVLWRSRYSNKLKWLLEVAVFGLVTLFAFVTARWDTTSYYLRILILPIFITAALNAYRRIENKEDIDPPVTRIRKNAGNIILITALVWLNANALKGYLEPKGSVDLAYPLSKGFYFVGGGGNSRWINNHNAFPPQEFALDIVELSAIGNPVTIGKQSELEKYKIFGRAIFSPCDGEVLLAIDGHKDQIPPNKDTINMAGNHVLIECEGVEILLAHLKQESIVVDSGQTVRSGDKIGAVGNSGNSTQPHLHIHAESGGAYGEILNGDGIPITFEGRFLVRNSLFTGAK